MTQLLRRWWKYLTASLSGSFNERADPKVQLEQAITESQEQHRRLREQAANVIANQKQTEMRLNRSLEELEKVGGNARQALLMATDAEKSGDANRTAELNRAAESFATRMISLEHEVEELKAFHFQATQAADQAKTAVEQNSMALQQKLSERQKLLGQLDQAKMQEQMNTAMASLSQTVGEDVPTLGEVRDKIEARYARARGMAELTENSVESRMLEVEQASRNTEASVRLAELRSQLGLAPATSGPSLTTGAAPSVGSEAPEAAPVERSPGAEPAG